jgi:hypothetical protein
MGHVGGLGDLLRLLMQALEVGAGNLQGVSEIKITVEILSCSFREREKRHNRSGCAFLLLPIADSRLPQLKPAGLNPIAKGTAVSPCLVAFADSRSPTAV